MTRFLIEDALQAGGKHVQRATKIAFMSVAEPVKKIIKKVSPGNGTAEG